MLSVGFVVILGLVALGVYEAFRASGNSGGCGPASCCVDYGAVQVASAMNCCCTISSDPATWPTGDQVWDVCRAVALAEGANVAGDAPDRNNNPGDLSKGDEHGQPIVGYVTLPDGEKAIQFANKTAGWEALYTKFNNIRLGISKTFSPSMTWRQIAAKYAGNSAAWVANVTTELGVSPDDSFGSYFS